jgi:uncharacterized protein
LRQGFSAVGCLDPSSWNPTAVPSVAQIAKAIKADMSLAQLEEYYAEENMRKVLY